MGVITVTKLNKSYFSRPILQDISFTLEEGERLALIGENGSGKTTLMRIVAGLETADSGSVNIAQGLVFSYLSQQMEEFTDLNVPVLSAGHLEKIQARLDEISRALAGGSQDEHASLLREYQTLTERFERSGGYSYLSSLAQALSKLGISGEVLDRPISSLSGGERMRVLLARRVLENADLLLLDEPTNHLDLDGLEWLEEYLQTYKGTVLFISHDRYFIDKTATRTAELQGAKISFYKGGYSAFQEQKNRDVSFRKLTLSRLEQERVRQLEVKQTMLSHRKMSAYHAREKAVARLEDQIADERDKLPQSERRMNFHFIPRGDKRDKSRVLLNLKEAGLSWDGVSYLFSQVDFELKALDKKVLVGPNGCGKSTLLAMIMGTQQNYQGELSLASGIRFGHLGQYAKFEDESKNLLQELQERTMLLEGDARNLLARYGFRENDIYKEIAVLSGGERSRLYLCCLLEEEPDVLFLDEPTNHLDIHSREVLEDAIMDFNGAVLAVSHDRYFIEKCGFGVNGFIGGGVQAYASYVSYRHFARLLQPDNRKDTHGEETAGNDVPTVPESAVEVKQNLVKLRKDKRKLTLEIKELEAAIAKAEAELEEAADTLSGTDPAAYQAYAELQSGLEELYEDFFAKSSEAEEITKLLEE